MALNQGILGTELYNAASNFNDIDIADINLARQQFWNAIAAVIVNHIQTYGDLNVPGLGLTAPNGPVTGTSTTGKML